MLMFIRMLLRMVKTMMMKTMIVIVSGIVT